ncbi:MAG: siderophore-interacting protein [Acidimicrobiia bacterium]|nr:siderophore-interacting protein [Acidimicrobiia bacterium]
MTTPPRPKRTATGRREPPSFKRVELLRSVDLSPRMVRVTLAGKALDGMVINEPAASVRLLVPQPGADLVIPEWNGNEFLLPDGSRPTIRTFTPRSFDAVLRRLDIDVVVHEGGAVVEWLESAKPGDAAAVSGPGRGYSIDRAASDFLLAGDETAIPAISQLLEALPHDKLVNVRIEVCSAAATVELPPHPNVSVEWYELASEAPPGSALFDAITKASLGETTHVWCAGEAAAMHRIRAYLFQQRGLPRGRASVRGYWKLRTGE